MSLALKKKKDNETSLGSTVPPKLLPHYYALFTAKYPEGVAWSS